MGCKGKNHTIYIVFTLSKSFTEPSCSLDESMLEETSPICIEIFYHRRKLVTQSRSVVTNRVKPQEPPHCFAVRGKGSFNLSHVQTSL